VFPLRAVNRRRPIGPENEGGPFGRLLELLILHVAEAVASVVISVAS